MSLETPFNGSLAARQPDRELDLILEGRERRDTREIFKQSAQRLLECCEVGRLHGDVAFRPERRGRGPRDFETSSRRWNPSPRRLTSTASSSASQPDLAHASACACAP